MTTEEQLTLLRGQIEHHRVKAKSLRRRAEMQDNLADAKVKECAALATPELTAFSNPLAENQRYPILGRKSP